MKTFSYEKTSTPKLTVVWIERDDVSASPTHGINVAIQDWWKDEIVRSIQNLFTQYQDEDDVEDDIAE
ncbi:unnamed protein product [Citrullus colocynthis]|uniref:Uncharacterized protein n=1 Tax=Citrullus colocynthis TaxID=252529 RepID=A0ABP0YT90_9ROSI